MKTLAIANSPAVYEKQVGGHHCLIQCEGFILKPFKEQEGNFYINLPLKYPLMGKFIPEFFGQISLHSHVALPRSPPLSSSTRSNSSASPRESLLEEFPIEGSVHSQTLLLSEDKSKKKSKDESTQVEKKTGNSKEKWLKKLYAKRYKKDDNSKLLVKLTL